jgi:NAD(P)H-hydrate epimerase
MGIKFKWVKDSKKQKSSRGSKEEGKLRDFADEISGKKTQPEIDRVKEFLKEKGEMQESVIMETKSRKKSKSKAKAKPKKEKKITVKKVKKTKKQKKSRKKEVVAEEPVEETEEVEEPVTEDTKKVQKRIPIRSKDSHKGDNGKVLVIGGSEFYVGAPGLAAMAAFKTGADLVYVSTIKDAAYVINGYDPGLITQKLDGKFLTEKHYAKIKDLIEKVDAIVIGCGIGTEKTTKKLVRKIVKLDIPKVIDGDALELIKGADVNNAVLTPHHGEFKELFGTSGKKESMMVYSKPNKIILLKGKIDYISDGVKLYKNKSGNPGMTVAGTGDVLAGIVGALLAIGFSLVDAARIGAHISGDVGDYVKKELGYCFTASDMIKNLPHSAKRFVK